MKIISILLSILLLSCATPKTERPTGVLSETEFENVLKEVHLVETAFELNKSKGVINAKNSLATSYQSIYKKHNIDKHNFIERYFLEYHNTHFHLNKDRLQLYDNDKCHQENLK